MTELTDAQADVLDNLRHGDSLLDEPTMDGAIVVARTETGTVRVLPSGRVLNEDDATDALGDALADLLHVHAGDEAAVLDLIPAAMDSARRHREAEAAGSV